MQKTKEEKAQYMRQYRSKNKKVEDRKIFNVRVKARKDGYVYLNKLSLKEIRAICGMVADNEIEIGQEM